MADATFMRLAQDTKLPFLEVQLIRKYFLERRDTRSVRTIHRIINVMEEHRRQTLRILGMCQARDVLVEDIMKLIGTFKSRAITTLEFQTAALKALYTHRQMTLAIVEDVFAWREALTRPFPFTYKGTNYFTKIIADCERIEGAGIEQVLPLRLSDFPLCSNVQAISLFGDGSAAAAAGGAGKDSISPERKKKKEKAMQDRLRTAEVILLNEPTMQQRIFAELKEVADEGRFVTLLNIPAIIPECATGIPVSNKHWDALMKDSIARAQEKAEADAAAHPHLATIQE